MSGVCLNVSTVCEDRCQGCVLMCRQFVRTDVRGVIFCHLLLLCSKLLDYSHQREIHLQKLIEENFIQLKKTDLKSEWNMVDINACKSHIIYSGRQSQWYIAVVP